MNAPADNTGESLTIKLPDDVQEPIEVKIDWVVKPHKKQGGIVSEDHHFAHATFWENLKFYLTGKRHHYEVDLTYYHELRPNGQWSADKFVTRSFQHGTASQRSMDYDHRHLLHQQLAPSLMKDMPKELLTNGMFKLTRIDYLGYW